METIGSMIQSMTSLKFPKGNIIEINDSMRYGKVCKTEAIAEKLVKKFNAPKSYHFFLKCAWNLSEDFIWSTYESSNKPSIKAPIKYFVSSCYREMSKTSR